MASRWDPPIPMPGEWVEHARCKGLDTNQFFPDRGDDVTRLRILCAVCQVRDDCLNYALANNINHGFWGGKSAKERIALRRAGVRPPKPAPVKKHCPDCDTKLPLDRFSPNRSRPDGLHGTCKDCHVRRVTDAKRRANRKAS